jgi:hypothetical protein
MAENTGLNIGQVVCMTNTVYPFAQYHFARVFQIKGRSASAYFMTHTTVQQLETDPVHYLNAMVIPDQATTICIVLRNGGRTVIANVDKELGSASILKKYGNPKWSLWDGQPVHIQAACD